MTAMVSFAAQTCAVPPKMNKSAYKIFILLSTKVSACILTAIQTALTNSSVWSPISIEWFGIGGLGASDRVV